MKHCFECIADGVGAIHNPGFGFSGRGPCLGVLDPFCANFSCKSDELLFLGSGKLGA